ncbi:MAG: amidohydrolase family protein [Chloroflexota bacterium]|nr:amidohydrolase family protein [Chloroflexota bacterium]
MAPKRVINGKIWQDGVFREADLLIDGDGKVVGIQEPLTGMDAYNGNTVDAGGCLVLPGGIDAHAHIEDGAETFYEGSCAAAVGGITTVVDMPPFHVCSTPEGFKARVEKAENQCVTDFCIHGGIVVEPDDLAALEDVAQAGAAGFKVFMPAEPPVSQETLWGAVLTAAKTGLRLVLHAEESACLVDDVDWQDPLGFANARPPVAETAATAMMLEMARAAGAPIHICHISAARTADLIDQYSGWGVDVTAETTPHFLTFSKEDFKQYGKRLKTTPPLRDAEDVDHLWEALREGVIDMVISDHYLGELPVPDREVSFETKQSGIAGLEVSLPLLYHLAINGNRLTMARFMEVTAENPAKIFGFDWRKGSLTPGMDADFVLFDPEMEWTVGTFGPSSRASLLPYEGWQLKGKIESTWVRGEKIWDGDSVLAEPGTGIFIAHK